MRSLAMIILVLASCGNDYASPTEVELCASPASTAGVLNGHAPALSNVVEDDVVVCPQASEAELQALAGVDMITGGLRLIGHPTLTTLDLENLSAVSGDVEIRSNHALTHLGLPALVQVDGKLLVTGDDALTTLEAPNLVRVGDLAVMSTALEELSLPGLEEVDEWIELDGEVLATIDLPALTHCDGLAMFHGAPALTSIALPALTRVDSSLFFYGTPALTSLDLASLETVGPEGDHIFGFTLLATGLSALELPALTRIGGRFMVYQNDALASLNAPLLTHVGGGGEITHNPALSMCDVESLLAQLDPGSTPPTVEENLACD